MFSLKTDVTHVDTESCWHSPLPENEVWKTSEQKQVQLSLAVMKTEVKSFCFWQSKLWWVYCADRQMWKSACSGLWARKSEGGRNTRVRQSDSERKRKWWKEKEKERKGTKARKGKRTKSEGVEAVRISWNQHPGISVQRTHWQV